jgi:multiple sugar transport system substrate-binding protein
MDRRTLLAAFAAGSLAAGCGRSPSGTVTLRFWAMGREGEVVRQLLQEFERTHPRIRVDVQQLPWSAAHQKLLTAFAGGSAPDLCQLGNTWLPEFVALDALEPLDARVATSDLPPADFFAGIWATNVVGERLYGVPWYVDTRLLFYRADLLAAAGVAEPPQDWNEWTGAMAAIEARAGPGRYAILLPVTEPEPLIALALQQADPMLRDGDRYGNFESEGFRRALEFYLGIFARGFTPTASAADVANVWNEFGRGYFASFVSGPWNIGELRRRLPPDLQGAWATAPLPGPHGPGVSIAGGSSLVLFRRAGAKDAAWQLIDYLSQPPVQQRFHALTGDLPPRRASWRGAALENDVAALAFREQLERVKPVPRVPEWERIATAMQQIAESTVHGQLSVASATRDLDARVDAILEKRRWLLARRATEAVQ